MNANAWKACAKRNREEMTMRRFLIRLVRVFALAIVGTGFLMDTSFAETARQADQQMCVTAGGDFFDLGDGKDGKIAYFCILPTDPINGQVKEVDCYGNGDCTLTICTGNGKECWKMSHADFWGRKHKGTA